MKYLCQRDVSWFKERVFFEMEGIVDYFDISKRAIDDEAWNISKTEGCSGILVYRSEETNTAVFI